MANEKIYLGLDIGTNSVGWAVTDEEYKLRKFKGNLMWGVHLFDEAQQSSERRASRTARRRLDRRQQRICLLQEFFAPEILKKDPKFFLRLKESALLPEDAENRKRNIFFDDENYGDKQYFEEYPTIHHLICELMDDPSPHDVRLVYYACAYLLSHRGHFLFPVSKDDVDAIKDFGRIYKDFYTALSELCGVPVFDPDSDAMAEIMKKHISVTAKDKELQQLLFGGKAPKPEDGDAVRYDQLTKLISGRDGVKLSDLFINDEYSELEKNSICVRKADFSDTLEELEGQIDELHLALLKSVKSIYDWSLLDEILHGNTMISRSKIEIYEQHKADLIVLKYLVRTYLTKDDYNEVFRNVSDKANYVSYVYNASSDDNRDKYKKCSWEDFCKFVKNYLDRIDPSDNDRDRYDDLYKKCEDGNLCPKQVTTDNRVIPYQLYYAELKRILENAAGYLPFLIQSDEYGTVSDKILSIMEFRIPYYVGPLVSKEKSDFAWMVRKNDGRIYPWNFEHMVDEDESENEFIRRMTCKCTYLAGEDVLPKYSLLYCKYSVLNEINNIKVNGEPISVELKQRLYHDMFAPSRDKRDKVTKRAKVTKKKIAEYFRAVGAYSGEIEITGIDDHIKSSLKSYHDFNRFIEGGILNEYEVERIIERITVTTDTKRLKRWLQNEYSSLSDVDVNYISKLKYKDYGRLSRRFLEEVLPVDEHTGEVFSDNCIISVLWETNDNLMQILSSKYRYSDAVEFYNKAYYDQPGNRKTVSERLKEMYLAPAVRRSVNRTLDIVKELKTILRKAPDKIFIEMSRGEGGTPKGKRTVSRRDKILECLNDANPDDIDILKGQLDSCDDGKLRSEKYYLYFMQLGKCAYTGRSISLEDIGNDKIWNIDHIWPQAKVKDDSIDNKVLVDSRVNGEKGDKYPINDDIRTKMAGLWHALREKNLMSEKKYLRLIRSTPFTDDELSGFIARQLVETRQSTKAVATLLKELFPETEIVYVKAGLVSEFRQEMGMLKCREINDLHHAKDAYLNIVMGNVYDTKFTKNLRNFIQSNEQYTLKLFRKDQNGKEQGLLKNPVKRGNTVAWNPPSSFDTVKKMMSKNSIRYVRYCYKRKSGQNGGLFDQNPLRKGKGMVPVKKDLSIEKYGGYDNSTISYYCIAKIENKGAVIAAIELLAAERFENDNEFAKRYLSKKLSTELKTNIIPEMISFPLNGRIIKINTVLELDGYRVMIAAKQNTSIKVVSMESLILDNDSANYAKKIVGYLEKRKGNKDLIINQYSGINKESNIRLFEILTDKCKTKPFSKIYNEIGEKMTGSKNDFTHYTLEEQVVILSAMINLMKTGRKAGVDLTKVGGKAHSGVKTLNSFIFKIKDCGSIRIIDQSPTGLYEKKSVNLLEL